MKINAKYTSNCAHLVIGTLASRVPLINKMFFFLFKNCYYYDICFGCWAIA